MVVWPHFIWFFGIIQWNYRNIERHSAKIKYRRYQRADTYKLHKIRYKVFLLSVFIFSKMIATTFHFAHGTITELLCHVQQFVAPPWPWMELHWNEISMELELWNKWNGWNYIETKFLWNWNCEVNWASGVRTVLYLSTTAVNNMDGNMLHSYTVS